MNDCWQIAILLTFSMCSYNYNLVYDDKQIFVYSAEVVDSLQGNLNY